MTVLEFRVRSPLRLLLVPPPRYGPASAEHAGIEEVLTELREHLISFGHEAALADPEQPAPATGSVLRLAEELRPHLVHEHAPTAQPAVPAFPAPTLVTVHGPVAPDVPARPGAGLVAVSQAQRRSAPRLPWIATVHNAVALHRWPFRSRDRKEDHVLVLGRCAPGEGIDTAILAARAAGRRTVLALRCSGPDEQEHFDAAVRPLLGPDTACLGEPSAEQRAELLGRAGCLLLPGRRPEPFGAAAVEAMACGTPVVALRCGAPAETVIHGVTGVLADREEELAAAVGLAARLDPRACREHVRRRFTGKAMALGYERTYLSFLGGNRAGTGGRGDRPVA